MPFISDRGKNVFFSAGLSALAGYETTNWNCKLLYDGATLKNDGCFIYGFAPAFEMEAFLSDRLVFLFNVRQRIFFGSSVGNFHTAVDVYKRQTYSGTQQGGIISPILANIYPVSYTHLDVYKRQLSPGKGRYDRTPLQRVYPLSRRIRQRRLPGVAKLRSLPPGKSTLTGHPS